MTDEREWPDPEPGPEWDRLRVRLACSAAFAVGLFLLFLDPALSWLDLLWPPRGSLSRWTTLLLLQLFSYVVVPGVAGTLVGDALYDRYLAD